MAFLPEAFARLVAGRGRAPSLLSEKGSRTGTLLAFEQLGQPVWSPRDYGHFAREGFMQNAILYRSVRMIAEAAASIPLLVYERGEELEDHPLVDLIRQPSLDHTSVDFFESWYGFLLVAGNAYVEAVALNGTLRELHILRPDRMKVIPGPDGWPEGYEYTAGGQSIRFMDEAVPGVRPILHVKMFHPANDHYGMSPIEAASVAIDIHNEASKWNKALLDNSARPSGALVYAASNGQMTGEQFQRLKDELETSYQGARHAGRPLLLEGGLDWKPLSLSPKDMDFIEAKNSAAREIALAMGVPPQLLGIPGDNTYSNYAEAQRAFWRQTVLPLVNRTARGLSSWLSPAYGGALQLKPDLDQVEALNPEREALWAKLDAASFLTEDEKRAAAGYGALSDGASDTPSSRRPAATERQRGEPPNAVKPEAQKYSQDQPRVPAGSSDGGQWTDGGGGDLGESGLGDIPGGSGDDKLDQVYDPTKYSVNLVEEDARGGHAVRDHVGKSDEEIIDIVRRDVYRGPNLDFLRQSFSTYDSTESANDFTNLLLRENSSLVDKVSSGELSSVWLEMRVGYPTGREAFRTGPQGDIVIRKTYNIGAYIVTDSSLPRGYRVHTSYPFNEYPQ